MSTAELRMARYWERKEDQRCVDCGAGLQDDDGVQCVECAERAAVRSARYYRRGGNKKQRVRQREARRNRIAQGTCSLCKRPPVEGKRKCAEHLKRAAEMSLRWYHKNRAGIAAIKRPLRAKPSPESTVGYRPLDELKQNPRVRILLQLSWVDWIDTVELFALLRVDASDEGRNPERDRYQHALCRLAEWGLAVKRITGATFADWRITDAGRAEVARFRRGDFATRKAA